jgi:hypothetical protein
MTQIYRRKITKQAVIASGAALSGVIEMEQYAGGQVIIPAAWDAAAIAFKVCATPDGAFTPLRSQSGALVEITGIVTNAAGAYPLPDELFGSLYVKLWSETSGSDTNQTAARSLVVTLKG